MDRSACYGKNGGIRDMYASNGWFFLHCSSDGPWCVPCATRGLVYNEGCGQCESSRHGKCTGPGKEKTFVVNKSLLIILFGSPCITKPCPAGTLHRNLRLLEENFNVVLTSIQRLSNVICQLRFGQNPNCYL